MLEQAKACLKSGARESLRCAKGAPSRSKRMLHSTFWNHGAGDLGLSPCIGPIHTVPSDLLLKHDNASARPGRKAKKEVALWSTPTDGFFLDFLYPPQALAYLNRASGQQGERWEKRNARRLPEGFIQASRGYASRTYTQTAGARPAEPHDSAKHISTESHKSASAMADVRVSSIEPSDRGLDAQPVDIDAGHEDPRYAHSPNDSADEFGFADSPVDLAYEEPADKPLRQLRSMLSESVLRSSPSQSSNRESWSDTLWTLYKSLDARDRDDLFLKARMLEWLSSRDDQQAWTRCEELYQSIPIGERTAQVYEQALSSFLKRNMAMQAKDLHKEALTRLDQAEHVTMTYIRFAVTQSRWRLALEIEQQWIAVPRPKHGRRPPQIRSTQTLWSMVSKIPRLLPRCFLLARYMRAAKHAGTADEHEHAFCTRFFRAAFVQEFGISTHGPEQRSFGKYNIPKASIRNLYRISQQCGTRDPQFGEFMIGTMIGHNARYDYAVVHEIVSYVYFSLWKMDHRVSPNLLRSLLERLTRYYDALQKHSKLTNILTVETLSSHWKSMHGNLTKDALMRLLLFYSRRGDTKHFKTWMDHFQEAFPTYEQQADVLWISVYLHARRAELPQAKLAFAAIKNFAEEHDQQMPLRCWNVMLHAHYRADDLEGAMDTLQALVGTGLEPDEYSMHPVMSMMALRGDVEGVYDMLSQLDSLNVSKRNSALIACLLGAHIRSGSVEKAEDVLRTSVAQHNTGDIRGPLTGCFNIVLTEHAFRRDIDATMRTYRWMKTDKIPTDNETFAALISALTQYRQSDAARRILTSVMKEQNLEPTAFHYALVMTGYIRERSYDKAIEVHDLMVSKNVRATSSSNAAYLKAKALQEHRKSPRDGGNDYELPPLGDVLVDLNNLLHDSRGADVSAKQPQMALQSPSQAQDTYLTFLIELHGKRRCLEAARKLFDKSKEKTEQEATESVQPSINLLSSFMSALGRAHHWAELKEFWLLAKAQADKVAASVAVPQLQPMNVIAAHKDIEAANVKPSDSFDTMKAASKIQVSEGEKPGKLPPSTPRHASLDGQRLTPTGPRPKPGRSHILTRPLRSYILALAAQSRISEMLSVVSQLYAQGYVMNNLTWNIFIQKLCQSKPPLALLAFTLTERFLIPQFPGWAHISTRGYIPNRAAKAEGLEYIRARYLRPDQLMPQYETMVLLASALLKLRQLAATGRSGVIMQDNMKGLGKYIGTVAQIRKKAPRTLFAVQSMPTVDDRLQRHWLKGRM